MVALNPYFLGRLIAIGGNEDKAKELVVLKRVVQEIGKTDFKVSVVTTASEDPEQRGRDYQKVFTTLGASGIEILNIKERAQANDKKLAKNLETADLIFFTGGDQLRLTTILGGIKNTAGHSKPARSRGPYRRHQRRGCRIFRYHDL